MDKHELVTFLLDLKEAAAALEEVLAKLRIPIERLTKEYWEELKK